MKQQYYVPSAPNTPLLSKKGDIGLDLLFTGSGKYSAWDFHGAYLPKKHFGVMAGLSHAYKSGERNSDRYSSGTYLNSTRYELGAGYITGFRNGVHLEAYAGIGGGKLLNNHYTGESQINTTHFFVQPTIAYVDPTVAISLVSKLSGVKFKVSSTFEKAREPINAAQVQLLNDKPFHMMFEPGFLLRTGGKHFKFNFGYNISLDLTSKTLHRGANNILVGVTFQWNTLKKL